MGLLCERQDKLSEALNYFNHVLKVDPKFVLAYNAKGMIYDLM